MAKVTAFRGIRYNRSIVGDSSDVVCPPYDIITPADAEVLRRRSPYNAVNLELTHRGPAHPPGDDLYSFTAGLFDEWMRRGVLIRDAAPAMYVVDEEFTYDGLRHRRRGLVCLVRLEEFDSGVVMPHERTTPEPVADRLALLEAAQANFSPLMSLYSDADGGMAGLLEDAVAGLNPLISGGRGQYGYAVRAILGRATLSALSTAMASRQLFLADGHHRYEAALRYRDEVCRPAGLPPMSAARYVMMTLIALDDPGLLLLPHHRVVGGLGRSELSALTRICHESFDVTPLDIAATTAEGIAERIQRRLAGDGSGPATVATFGPKPAEARLWTDRNGAISRSIAPSLESCGAWVLHRRVIEKALAPESERDSVSFLQDPADAVRAVQDGSKQMAFILQGMDLRLFEAIVRDGRRLPPKSTCFHPKLPTGLVINSLEGDL